MDKDYILKLNNKEVEKLVKSGGEQMAYHVFQIFFFDKKYVKASVVLPYINEVDRFEYTLMTLLNSGDAKKVVKLVDDIEVIGFNTAYLRLFSLILTRANKLEIEKAFKVALVHDYEIAGVMLDEIMMNKVSSSTIQFIVSNQDIINKCTNIIKKYLTIYQQYVEKINSIKSYIAADELYKTLANTSIEKCEFINLTSDVVDKEVELLVEQILLLQDVKLTSANYIPPKEVRNIVVSTTFDEQGLEKIHNKKSFKASDYPLLVATFKALVVNKNIEIVKGKINIVSQEYDITQINNIVRIYNLLNFEKLSLLVLLYIDDAINRGYKDISISSIVELLYGVAIQVFERPNFGPLECIVAFKNTVEVIEIMGGEILYDLDNDRLRVVKNYASKINVLKSLDEINTSDKIEIKYVKNYPHQTELLNYTLSEGLRVMLERNEK